MDNHSNQNEMTTTAQVKHAEEGKVEEEKKEEVVKVEEKVEEGKEKVQVAEVEKKEEVKEAVVVQESHQAEPVLWSSRQTECPFLCSLRPFDRFSS